MSNKQELARTWEMFVSTGILDSDQVPLTIGDSWRRCRESGVNPYVGGCHQLLDAAELAKLLSRKKKLISITRPFMENLYNFVADSGFIVMLADENGYIMETLGDLDTNQLGRDVNLVPGSRWIEKDAGTNGIGTALIIQKPVQVSGEEHYCRNIHSWTCSAAPIFDDNGQMMGILQMSGPSYASNKHTLGMVVAAVKAIEEQLLVQQKNRELNLLNSRLNSIFQTMSDGVIIVDPDGLIEKINPAAELILSNVKEKIEGVHIENVLPDVSRIKDMLDSDKPFSNIEVMAESARGHIHCLASGGTLKDDHGFNSGAAIIINPINKIKKLVNRFSGAEARFEFSDIIGQGSDLQEAIRIASLAAENDSNVLLAGESGTGKEVFAQAIHNRSPRRDGPFVALNCAAIPRELMGSELFGYVEGAFTGAYRGGRPGKFELASGGTLFLDEIGDMTQGKQGSLLRAIQERKIIRIGDNKVIPVDVRIICATNKDLRGAVEKGTFREDLFYRLNVITINLPSLRDHREDIPLLFDHFLDEISHRLNINIDDYEPDIIPALKQYAWPGNIRELQNTVERMLCVAHGNRLTVQDLPVEITSLHPKKTRGGEISREGDLISVGEARERRKHHQEEKEIQEIKVLLGQYGGNLSMVARQLGVSRNTIYRKIKQYNILL